MRWEGEECTRARRKKETHDTGNVFRRERNETCKFSKDGKRFTGCKCARLSKLRRDFSKFPISEPSPDYIKFFSITGNSPTVLSLSLSARLSVSELGKKRLPSRFVRAKVLFSLVFFCHTKILSDNRKVFFFSRFSFSHSLCVFFISLSFSSPPFFLRFIILSMKDDTGTFARATRPRSLKQ